MEITTATPDGRHSQRLEATEDILGNERIYENVEDRFKTRTGWGGRRYTYNRPSGRYPALPRAKLY